MGEINQERMTLLVECEDCKSRFKINSNESNETASSINHKKEFNVNGQSIFLTYYDCPSCGRRHYVQIDDAISLGNLKEISQRFIALSVMKHKGKKIPKKQSAEFKRARQNLSVYRMNLMKKYTGKLVHDNETDSDFILRFSV